ncbi:HAD-IA family hydrolase [Martelella lutilitoris]|uniref:HAD-IA family hydrolase n=2 Tax=Martelella lutilitoris TaxID=2583532 RepID=A0A5C4JVK0_9HYPH|nr:HAD-IA family hydrolase [Martelella lutilitoris]
MKRCLMLDVDGVVVNGRPGDRQSWAVEIERDLGIDPLLLEHHFFRPHWPDVVAGRKQLVEVLNDCLPVLRSPVTAQDFINYWFTRDSDIDADVLAACDTLRARGMTIYLATNQEHLRAQYLMKTLGLGDHVDGIVYSAALGVKKPDSAFFEKAARLSGFAPADHVLVDDQMKNVEAARQVGWAAFAWTGEESLKALMEKLEG